jgi:hypothetical protein
MIQKLKSLIICLLSGVAMACVFSGFTWGIFSVATGEINGCNWNNPAQAIYGFLGLIYLIAGMFGSMAFYTGEIEN